MNKDPSQQAVETLYAWVFYFFFLSQSSMTLSYTMVAKIVNTLEDISISSHEFFIDKL